MNITREENYDAGRKMAGFSIYSLGYMSLPVLSGPYMIVQAERYMAANIAFLSLVNIWESLRQTPQVSWASPPDTLEISINDFRAQYRSRSTSLSSYHFLAETLIFNMRRFFESHLHIIQIKRHRDESQDSRSMPKSLKLDQLSNVLHPDAPEFIVDCFFTKDVESNKARDFLDLINRLGNSMRHHALFSDTFNLVGETSPTIVGIETPQNKLTEGIHHNHCAYHIMMGFQDVVFEIMESTEAHFRSS